MTVSIGGMAVKSTKDVINRDTKICGLCYARNKLGKTTLGATLHKMCLKYTGKPALFVAVEAAEGGGTMSIQEMDVPYVQPQNLNDMERLAAALATDKVYGGVILDNLTDLSNRFLKPYALKFPSREKMATREAGVPERSDYQTMGEKMRIVLNSFINLTVNPDPQVKKHLLALACEKEKTDDRGTILQILPELPGAMATASTAMFQTIMTIGVRNQIVDDPAKPGAKKQISNRVLITEGNGIRIAGDRTKVFPAEGPLDFVEIWEKYWIPRIEGIEKDAAAGTVINLG